MQNPIQKFRQSSINFQEPVILSENLKTLTSSNFATVQYFLLKLCTCFLLTNVYKSMCGIFLFCLDLELFAKILKRSGFYTLIFYTFSNNSRFKQSKKKILHTLLLTLLSRKRVCKILAKNIKPYGSWSSSKFSIFLTKNLVSWK